MVSFIDELELRPYAVESKFQAIDSSSLSSLYSINLYSLSKSLYLADYKRVIPDEKQIEILHNYFEKSSHREYIIISTYLHGLNLYSKGDYRKSLITFLETIELSKRADYNLFHIKALYFSGNIYLDNLLYEEAIKKYNEAISLCDSKNLVIRTKGIIYNSLAEAFFKMNHPDSALLYIEKSIRFAEQIFDKQTIDKSYFLKTKILSSINDLAGAQQSLRKISPEFRVTIPLKDLMDFIVKMKIRDTSYVNVADIQSKLKSKKDLYNIDNYKSVYTLYKEARDYQSALYNLKLYNQLKDSSEQIIKNNYIKETEEIFDSEINKINREKLKQNAILTSIAVLLISFLIFVIIFYYWQNKKNKILFLIKQKEDTMIIYKDMLKSRLELIRVVLNILFLYGDTKTFNKKIFQSLTISSFGDNVINNFLKLVNQSHFGVINVLRNKYPDLSISDLAFCGFIITGLSSEEISVLFDYRSDSAFYMRCKRIGEKLGIDYNLPSYLNNLLYEIKHNEKKA